MGCQNAKGVKKFSNLFLVHRSTECEEIWHNEGHLYKKGEYIHKILLHSNSSRYVRRFLDHIRSSITSPTVCWGPEVENSRSRFVNILCLTSSDA